MTCSAHRRVDRAFVFPSNVHSRQSARGEDIRPPRGQLQLKLELEMTSSSAPAAHLTARIPEVATNGSRYFGDGWNANGGHENCLKENAHSLHFLQHILGGIITRCRIGKQTRKTAFSGLLLRRFVIEHATVRLRC